MLNVTYLLIMYAVWVRNDFLYLAHLIQSFEQVEVKLATSLYSLDSILYLLVEFPQQIEIFFAGFPVAATVDF